MSTKPLFDAPGPCARRRHTWFEFLCVAVIFFGLYEAYETLAIHGEFSQAAWKPFTQPGLWALRGQGLLNNLRAAAVGMALSLLFGALLAFGLLSTRAPVRIACRIFTDVFASVPLLLLL